MDMGDFAGVAPLRGSCVGDGSSSYQLNENEDGSLTYPFYPNMPQWPVGEDLFADLQLHQSQWTTLLSGLLAHPQMEPGSPCGRGSTDYRGLE